MTDNVNMRPLDGVQIDGGDFLKLIVDLTFPTGEGWLYLAVTLDMHPLKIVGWPMRQTLHTELHWRR
jgi:hypothetical protein